MKTKRALTIGGGTALCAALTLLIAMTFKPEDEQQLTASTSEPTSTPAISVDISASNSEKTENPDNTEETDNPGETYNNEDVDNIEEADNADSDTDADSQPEIDFDDFIEKGGIEVKQDFTAPPPVPDTNTEQNTPPEPPKIEDEAMLTNPKAEPTYTPEQLQPTTQTTTNTSKHGDTKDGMIYITGFGWVKDEGGGGRGEAASDMYENGNKIGYFG